MLARLALIVCALCVLQPAIATEPAPTDGNLCRQTLPTIRELWQDDLYDAPPAVAAVMVEAIDGKLSQVRQGLAALPVAEQAHWRQVAMLTAANAYQPTVVDGLLDDGATVDGSVLLPPFKGNFARQVANSMAQGAGVGPRTMKGLHQLADNLRNVENLLGPALISATECSDTATLDVLLRHHANAMARQTPDSADALMVAVVHGNAIIVSRLLDHGADVCADDRHIRKPGTTLASIGRRQHLPDALLQRLTCHAKATSTVH